MGRNEWIRTLNRAALSVKDSLHIQFSPSTDWVYGCGAGGGRPEGRFSRDPLPDFSAGGRGEQIWHGQECRDVQAVVVRDMHEPCESLDSCQTRFLWVCKQ